MTMHAEPSDRPTLDRLAEALIQAAPTLDASRRAIARSLYRLLASGEAVSVHALAEASGQSGNEVNRALADWPGVYRDDRDDIVGFWGLSLGKMPHRLTMNGVQLYAWCAWDTLFLPATLQGTVHVQSEDPQTSENISLTVTPDAVTTRSHDRMVVSFLTPDRPFDSDVITTFCHYVHFFTGPHSARTWERKHRGTFSLSLDDAFELGRRWNVGRGL